MYTQAAQRSRNVSARRRVLSRPSLYALGVTGSEIKARVAAHRWRMCGRAVVLHNSALTRRELWDVALINGGPRVGLAAFTAAEAQGLVGWSRDSIHLIGPPGTPAISIPGQRVVMHRSQTWTVRADSAAFRCQALAPALIRAAGTFASARPACAILAAGVQQRLVEPGELRLELDRQTRVRHRAQLVAAVRDIDGGADSLSEIDFVRLCRKSGLPPPEQQTVRLDSRGRRRYLDATWRRPDGRLVVVEVDGALHLSPKRWWEDQLRQNEITLGDALVLRFPSVVIRTEQALVVAQLRRALFE